MSLFQQLLERWTDIDRPFLIQDDKSIYFDELEKKINIDLSTIEEGDVVAIIGDFEIQSIVTLIKLIDKNVVIVPLTMESHVQHEYFFEAALVDVVIKDKMIIRRDHQQKNILLDKLREVHHPGLVLFSTGTTGNPKAILHDFTIFLKRFETPRPTLSTLSFLLFDHIGGLNTLFHTLFNQGTIISTKDRSVSNILSLCKKYHIEVLPTTPTFLRMMLMSGRIPDDVPECLSIITYGTERMDQPTLNALCKALPSVDFRQTFGMSELGILRIKSLARDSLFMKVGGEGVETKVKNQVLYIRSNSRMLGYLNAPNPFDEEGWYNTKDMVEEQGDYIKIIGRTTEVINVGGLKFMASQIEQIALEFTGVELVKVVSKNNPITGQHVELLVNVINEKKFNKVEFLQYLNENLPRHMVPAKIIIGAVTVGHRFKKG